MMESCNRREFLRVGGRTVLAATAAVTLLRCNTESTNVPSETAKQVVTVNLADQANASITVAGGTGYVSHPIEDRPIIVYQDNSGKFFAYSSRCTHEGCQVELPPMDGVIVCPCHDAVFTLKGVVVSGPTKTDLLSYAVEHSGDTLRITL